MTFIYTREERELVDSWKVDYWLTVGLRPSDVLGQCRDTTWPTEQRSSPPRSSSSPAQMSEQSGTTQPGTQDALVLEAG